MIYVTRAIIVKDSRILAVQRPASMSLPFKWELPGGKCEAGEDPETCLLRESYEEMRLHVRTVRALPHVDRHFREKHYRMLPFICEVVGGKLEVVEHEQALWQPANKILELDWAPAEGMVMKSWYEKVYRRQFEQAAV